MRFEPEELWERPSVRIFERVNGGEIFETCHMNDKGSVALVCPPSLVGKGGHTLLLRGGLRGFDPRQLRRNKVE
jgi:hypothetical protein